MRFSVLIPTFNRPELLKAAIESAVAQTHADKEIVIIDDGPSEETRNVTTGFGTAVRYIRQDHGGKAAALNRGIADSAGDAIVVLDDDDLFPPWTLAVHDQVLSGTPAADFSFGRFVRFTGLKLPPASELLDEEFVPVQDPRRLVIKLMENCFLPNPSWAVRRDAQLRAGPYNNNMRYSEDYDMILRLARTNEGAFINRLVLYQRKHLSNRGPSDERTFASDAIEKWVKYDAFLFERIDREWDLRDFRPFPDGIQYSKCNSPAFALLQKGIVLFQRKVYDRAMEVLAEYRETMAGRTLSRLELRMAAGLLGCRYGINELAAAEGTGISLKFRAQRWPRSLRAAFASQVRWRLRAALGTGDVSHAMRLARFSYRSFGAAATAIAMVVPDRSGTQGWQQ
jgi:glycosyltransferase involved in cell wall biosynthesis